MNPDYIELKQIGLLLAEPTYDYLAGIDSEKMWEARGLTAYNQDAALKASLKAQRDEAVERLQNTPEGKARIRDFCTQCREVMRAILLGNHAWLDQYLGNRHFILLCGLHRSGGSYLLDELAALYQFPYRKFHCMHDDLPSFFPTLYWKWPHYYLQYIAEVAQFLVIVRESVPWKVVVKKRALWTFAIESLAHMFHGKLTIFMHVRHPISWAWGDTALREGKQAVEPITCAPSMKQYVELYDTPLPPQPAPCELMIRFWKRFHSESLRKNVDLRVLPFGQYDAPLKSLARELGSTHEPDTFSPSPRDYSRYADFLPQAENAMQEVQTLWESYGKSFPALELI